MNRPNFKKVQSQLDTLQMYANQAHEFNMKEWPDLNHECNGIIYDLGGTFEKIYSTGRDLSIFISSRFGGFYDVGEYPTLKSFVDSFEETWLNEIDLLDAIVADVKNGKERWQNNWAFGEMVKLFEKEIELLRATNIILRELSDSNTYRKEAGLPKKEKKMKNQKIKINATNVQVGDHNHQQIVQTFTEIVNQIKESDAPDEEKKNALDKLAAFVNLPLVSSVAGAALGAIIGL
jgi:hypothetical protein